MPRFDFNDEEMRALQTYLRGLIAGTDPPQSGRGRGGRGGVPQFQPHPTTLQLEDGRALSGTLTSESQFSATLLTSDGKFHLLARNGGTYRECPIEPKGDWT
jgi:hypothetical protein